MCISWSNPFAWAYSTCEEREPRLPFAHEANSLSGALLDLITVDHFKVDRVLPECAINIYLCHVVDVAK